MNLLKRKRVPDQSGAVSIEFIIIVSFYIFTCTTLFTAVDVFVANNKGYKGNAVVTNVTSRFPTLDDSRMDDLFLLYQRAAAVDAEDAWMRLTAVSNVEGTFEVQWSFSTAGAEDCLANDDKQIEEFIPNVANGDEVLLLETSLDYSPIFGGTVFGDMTFSQRAVFISRFAPKTDFVGFSMEEDCKFDATTVHDPDPGDSLEDDATEPTEEVTETEDETLL